MALTWKHESPAYWDEAKAAIVGDAPPGTFGDRDFSGYAAGDLLPDDWWRAEEDGAAVGFGWMDTTWGDAEILLAVAPPRRGQGVGTFILDQLEREARERGLNYLYNRVHVDHPEGEAMTRWLEARRFESTDDGKLHRAVTRPR